MSDPRPVSESLGPVRARLVREPSDGPPVEVDDLELIRDRVETAYAERWRKAMPKKFWEAHCEDFADPTGNALRMWDIDGNPPNLVITGPVGVGKSHAAVAAVRQAFLEGGSVSFRPAPEMFDQLRSQYDRGGDFDSAISHLMEVDRLIIDDLGAERPTEWSAEKLAIIVNRRWLEERPTVVTTNLTLAPRAARPRSDMAGLEERVGEHCFSRLVGGALGVVLSGRDRRRRGD